MAAPTQEELIILKKFRETVTDLDLTEAQRTDTFLLTWLRARDLDIQKAKEMLSKSLAWMKSEDIANILNWTPPESYSKLFPSEILGKSKDDCPVSYGKWDVRSTIEAGEKEKWFRYVDHEIALVSAIMDETNRIRDSNLTPVSQCIMIVDLDGIECFKLMSSPKSIGAQLEIVSRLDSNHPELVNTIYFINAPRIFSILFEIVKPALSARTFSKIQMFTSNESKWKPALLKNIPMDQLPPTYGGTNSKIFNSISLVQAPPTNNSGERKNLCESAFSNTHIAPGNAFKVAIDVKEMDTILCWAFKIESHDIGFSIILNDEEEVLPNKKYTVTKKGQVDLFEGSIKCRMTGTYTLIFDNTYSRFRSKNLDYNVYTK